MPGRLIAFVLALLIIVTFIGFNVENKSDIRIWFGENGVLEDVPIFVSFFVMYLIGVLSSLPFVVVWRARRRARERRVESVEVSEDTSNSKKALRVLGAKRKTKDSDVDDGDIPGDTDGAADEEDDPGPS